MAQRRMMVFAGIIVLGIVVGIFCLPGGVDNDLTQNQGVDPMAITPNPQPDPQTPPPIAPVPVRNQPVAMPQLPKNEIVESPENSPEAKFVKATTMTNMKEKLAAMVEVYKADPKGRWGGEAAAQIGFASTLANPERSAQWLNLARQNPISNETRAKICAELKIADPGPAPQQPINVQVQEMTMIAYKVQANDNLWVLGKRYGVSGDLIKMINKLPNDKLNINQSLKIPEGPFHVVISKSNHTLELKQGDKIVKVYRVALGKDGGTPVGEYTVTNKLENPKWYSPEGPIPFGDPRNMLGTRWIGFAPTYGIHGTRAQDENTIGTDASAGCVRMLNKEVEELYQYLIITKSKVSVVQ